jgi:hypothetical protein
MKTKVEKHKIIHDKLKLKNKIEKNNQNSKKKKGKYKKFKI